MTYTTYRVDMEGVPVSTSTELVAQTSCYRKTNQTSMEPAAHVKVERAKEKKEGGHIA